MFFVNFHCFFSSIEYTTVSTKIHCSVCQKSNRSISPNSDICTMLLQFDIQARVHSSRNETTENNNYARNQDHSNEKDCQLIAICLLLNEIMLTILSFQSNKIMEYPISNIQMIIYFQLFKIGLSLLFLFNNIHRIPIRCLAAINSVLVLICWKTLTKYMHENILTSILLIIC